MSAGPDAVPPLWQPSSARIADAAITGFRDELGESLGFDLPDSEALIEFSIADPRAFWDAVFTKAVHCGSRGSGPALMPLDQPPGARFFPAARVCYAEEVLYGGELAGAAATAVIYRREDGHRREMSWREVRDATAGVVASLQDAGVGEGDVVGAWLPNIPEAVVAMLATNSLGAVFTSASPDFGPEGLSDRFAQVSPKVLVVADAYCYAGKVHDRLSRLPEVLELLPSVRTVIVVAEVASADEVAARLAAEVTPRLAPAVIAWPQPSACPLDFRRVGYDRAGFVLYSSGTTGKPKCIVHSALGLLIKHWTEHALHSDIRPGDRVFYFTTTGWMMWNWLVGALAVGATVVLYDGAPLHRDGTVLWSLAEEEKVTFFGASAKFFDACRAAGLTPADHDLQLLRTVASTGSPLAPADFAYIYRQVSPDVHMASISGGTDICGCFVLGDPTKPVYAGEIQTRALGADVDVVDEDGESLRSEPGRRGELICRNALPSMPLEFAGDSDFTRYRAAYFQGVPGVWTHGDFAYWTGHGGIVITGRSDATLNAGGVRIGTAEIYRHAEALPEVAEALAVGQEYDNDTRIVLFVRLADGAVLDDGLADRIRTRLRTAASPRHVPALIVAAHDFPRTRSGKLAELAVADVINNRPVRNTHALANPESLAAFARLPELQSGS